MIKRYLIGLLTVGFFFLLPAEVQAACDYEIGDSSNTLSATRTAIDEELTCIEAAIGGGGGGGLTDGDKQDITVSGSGTIWNIDAGAVGSAEITTDAVNVDELNATGVESELEAVLDLNDLQDAGSGSFWQTGLYGVTSTDAGAAAGPGFRMFRDSASPAVNDEIGDVDFWGENSAASGDTLYAGISAYIIDPTFGSIDGRVTIRVATANAVLNRLHIGAGIYSRTMTDMGVDTANFDEYFENGVNIDTLYSEFVDFDTSSELRGILGDEVGTGAAMFGLAASMSDDLSCTGSQVVRRNSGDTAFECATAGGLASADIDTSAELRAILTDEAGTGALLFGFATTAADDLSCTGSQVVRRNAGDTAFECATISAGGLASTDIDTSAELRVILGDETGTGALMFGVTTAMADDLGCTGSQFIRRNAGDTAFECVAGSGAMATTDIDTSAELRAILTDEAGTGALLFGFATTAADDLACTGSQVVRRNSGDTAFECATIGALTDGDKGGVIVASSGTVWTLDLTVANTWTAQQIITLSSSAAIPQQLISTNADAVVGPVLDLSRNSASPAVNDAIGQITFNGTDTAAVATVYGLIRGLIIDPTDTSEDGVVTIWSRIAGSLTQRWIFGDGFYADGLTDTGADRINAAGYDIAGTSLFATGNTWTNTQTVSGAGVFFNALNAVSTEASASAGPYIMLQRQSASPAAADVGGTVLWRFNDSAANTFNAVTLDGTLDDPTNGSEDVSLRLTTSVAGKLNNVNAIFGAGIIVGGASGGDPGNGQVNATGYRLNGTNLFASSNSWTNFNAFSLATSNSAPITITSTAADNAAGPLLNFFRDSASPASSDSGPSIQFIGRDSAANVQTYGGIVSFLDDVTSGSEDGSIFFQTTIAGSLTNTFIMQAGLRYGAGADMGAGTVNAVAYYLNGVRDSESFCLAASDETSVITTGVAKTTFRMPYAFTLTAVRASVNGDSSSGVVTFDINEGGTTILSTKLNIDANEETSVTAATVAVISDAALASDAEITFDVDAAGTGTTGAKICMIGNK